MNAPKKCQRFRFVFSKSDTDSGRQRSEILRGLCRLPGNDDGDGHRMSYSRLSLHSSVLKIPTTIYTIQMGTFL